MSDTSSSRVTITLGRSGQVVKRDLSVADVSSSSPTVGIKRSIRDRIGNNADSSLWHGDQLGNNKRRRGDVRVQNGVNDVRIGKDDLRLKLLQKNTFRQAESNDDKRQIDLREKLSKTFQPPVPSINSRQHMPEPREAVMLRRMPSSRSSDELTRAESMKSSYSPWTWDHIRQRSPDGFPSTSRRISPQRNVEELQRRPLNRTYDDVRSASYAKRDLLDSSRPTSTAPESFIAQSTVSTMPPTTAKPVAAPLTRLPPLNSSAQRPSYTGDEQQTIKTVDGLLHSLGLGKYSILFKAEEVDMTALKQMREQDLKELGIPMGPRKKILLAFLPQAKRQP